MTFRMKNSKSCLICGEEFTPENWKDRYCSEKCLKVALDRQARLRRVYYSADR